MSMKTWKEKFYPVEAEVAAKDGVLAAVDHSIKKWEGLTQENLKAHGVRQQLHVITTLGNPMANIKSPNNFSVNGRTCALCVLFATQGKWECDGCPLYEVRGAKCFKDGVDRSPYRAFCEEYPGRAEPMIEALKAARELVLRTANVEQGAPEPTPEASKNA